MEIFRVDYCKSNGDIMQSALFDNFDSAKRYFDEIRISYETNCFGKGNRFELWKMTSCKDGHFEYSDWLNECRLTN